MNPNEIPIIVLPDITTAIVVVIGVFFGLMGGLLNVFIASDKQKGMISSVKAAEFLLTGALAGFSGSVIGMYLGFINPWVLWLLASGAGLTGRPAITWLYDRVLQKEVKEQNDK